MLKKEEIEKKKKGCGWKMRQKRKKAKWMKKEKAR